jgi:hypothetical protein
MSESLKSRVVCGEKEWFGNGEWENGNGKGDGKRGERGK